MSKNQSMMISAAMNAKLNEQMMAEFAAAQKYLAMACAFERMGLKVFAARFIKQYDEERGHATKIMKYLQEVGANVTIEALAKPRSDYDTVESIVRAALDSEWDITRRINELVSLAETEKDYATRSFLQWFVDEQVEEVSSMNDLLRLVELAGTHVLQVEARLRDELSGAKD